MAGAHAREHSCLRAEMVKTRLAIDSVTLETQCETLTKAGRSPAVMMAFPEIMPPESDPVPVVVAKGFLSDVSGESNAGPSLILGKTHVGPRALKSGWAASHCFPFLFRTHRTASRVSLPFILTLRLDFAPVFSDRC